MSAAAAPAWMENWESALALVARGRDGDAGIHALWAGVGAHEAGRPIEETPPVAEADIWLLMRWCEGWRLSEDQARRRALRDAALERPAVRLPYADA